MLNSKIPEGPLERKWTNYQEHCKIVNPANKNKLDIIVIGTGLSGAPAAATLAELGYKVKVFFFQDTARRAHSVAAQGGINASKNYQNDGDNVFRHFHDTLKGGDFRSREANTYRLAELSAKVIDQAVAQGFLLPGNMEEFLQTVLSVEFRSKGLFMHRGKQVNRCCSGLIQY